jgi:SWI/SNF-related matrix-associated actin-dependent regulator 1 of chromatin subfamily A
MGLGKTVEALCALPEVAMAIVICPAILKPNWAKECERWRPDLTPTIVEGRAGFRLPDVGEVLICNYDILPSWLEPVKKKDAAEDWDTEVSATPEVVAHAKQCIVIVDEGHKVKNHRTARAKRVRGLVKITSRVWVLTGTPLENRPFDLWGVLSATGMARDVFGSFPKFVARMGGRPGQYGGYEFDGPVDPIVPDLLKRVMLRRLRAEVLPDLPKITYSTVVCPLPVGLRSDMDALWAKYGPLIDRDRELPPFEEFSALRAQLAESRIEPAIELAEACEEALCPLVVFSAHVAPVVTLGKRPGWACIHGAVGTDDRQRIVDAFQAGRLQGVALTIGTGGSGLTLHRAWKAIFLDLDWVPSQNEQAAARLCRIGQESDKVEVVRMVSDHVMDRHVLSLISWKMGVIESALNDNGRLAAVQ